MSVSCYESCHKTPDKKAIRKERAAAKVEKLAIDDEDDVIKKAVEARKAKFRDEADQKYAEAMRFFKDGNMHEAQLKFIQVEALIPGYKDGCCCTISDGGTHGPG